MDKVSDTYIRLNIKDYVGLETAAETISKFACDGNFELVELPNKKIGFLCKIEVDAGTASLIKRVEPIIISVDKDNPESRCPIAYPDRTDFPFTKFPHINYPTKDMPPSLCLSRENSEEWFSEITFEQYLKTLKQWLDDAANGNLIKLCSNDEFEPFRVPYTNQILIWYNEIDEITELSSKSGCNFHDVDVNHPIGKVNYGDKAFDKKGLLVHLYQSNQNVFKDWYIRTPSNIQELYSCLAEMQYSIEEKQLVQILNGNPNIEYVYISFSVTRPTKIIGKTSKVDSICYLVDAKALINKDMDAGVTPVVLLDRTTPFFAAHLSNVSHKVLNNKILFLGVGALGSKIADHLYRGGIYNLTLCDNDSFLPHNVVRHVLSNGLDLHNKAQLMKEHFSQMFMLPGQINVVDKDAVEYICSANLSEFSLIVDATASNRVMYALDELKISVPIIRVCLSAHGQIGMTYVKYSNEILIQEYYMEILRNAIDNEDIATWIKSDVSSSLDRIRIGEGCHSNTMIVSDDMISSHAAISSRIIKQFLGSPSNKNELYLSFADYDYCGSLYTDKYDVPQYISIPTDNPKWLVKIPQDLLQQIRIQTKSSGKNETGGYLLGVVSEKRKTIFILQNYVPKDSSKKPMSLRLGTSGWNDFLKDCQRKTGGQLQYLGDWHSHPNGTTQRSSTDKDTFNNIKTELSGIGACLITNGHAETAYIISH